MANVDEIILQQNIDLGYNSKYSFASGNQYGDNSYEISSIHANKNLFGQFNGNEQQKVSTKYSFIRLT